MVTSQRSRFPFVGLQPFTEEEADLFFGRDAATHALLAAWLRRRIVVAYGPAGSGKTSLLLAGVLPILVSVDADVLPLGRIALAPPRDGATMTEDGIGGPRYGAEGSLAAPAVAEAGPDGGNGNPYLDALMRSWACDSDAVSLVEAIRNHPARLRPFSASRPILAAVDQFEELFTPRSPHLEPLRTQFFEVLAQAVSGLPNLRLLLVVRSNHRAALAAHEPVLLGALCSGPGGAMAVARGGGVTDVLVGPLDRPSAVAALTEPLRLASAGFTPGAAAVCVEDLATSRVVDAAGAESVLVADTVQPVFLQLVATAMLRSQPEDTPITAADLAAAGGASAALGDHVTQVLVSAARELDLDEDAVRSWLTRMFITERGRRATVDEGLASTAGMPNALLDLLADRYVLRCEHRSGSRRFELFDDRLVEPLQQAFPQWSVEGTTATDTEAADHLRAAQVSLADGDLAGVQAHAEEALRRDRDLSLARARTETLRGEMHETEGRREQAQACYREAAELYESLSDTEAAGRVLASLGRLLLRAGQVGRAVEELQAASERLPGDPEVQSELAHALWFAGQPWAAAAIFSTVLTITPDSQTALTGRALLLVELADDAAALADFDRLSHTAPQVAAEPELRAARALALARLGRVPDASDESTAALREAPDSGPVLWRAAETARVAGDSRGADDLLRRSLDASGPALAPHQQELVRRALRRSDAVA